MPFLAPPAEAALTVLATGEELAAYLQEDDLPADQVDLALAIASGVARGYCGWRIDFARQTFTVERVDGTLVLLKTLRLVDVVSVTVDGTLLDSATDYTWTAGGLLWGTYAWSTTPRGIVVVADHGYDPVPDEVKGVVLGVASRLLASPDGLTREQVGAWSGSYSSVGLLDHEQAALDPYRLEQA